MKARRSATFLTDHVTFGYGIHFLLEVLLLQFASIFLTFQFSNSLLIQISNQNLFIGSYVCASLVFFAVLILFTSKMRKRTFSPKLHSYTHLTISIFGYLVASGVTIVFGYLLLILATAGVSGIGLLDYVFSGMLTTLFAALMAVGYHARVFDDRPDREEIVKTINEWESSLSWIDEDDRSNAKQDAYNDFENQTGDLVELLSSAKTSEGKELQSDFHSWKSRFDSHSKLSKETIIKGQQENKNERLEREHRDLESLRRRLRIIAGKQE